MSNNIITEGMPWSEAINIINNLIAVVQDLKLAIGGSIVNGKIDFNSLANIPTINGVVLSDQATTESLKISLSQLQLELLNANVESRVSSLVAQSLDKKASSDLSTLQSADADIGSVSFFINDKDGVPKKVSIDTLKAFFRNELPTSQGGVTVNNGGDTTALQQELSTFKDQVSVAITQIENSLTGGGIALTDCSGGTCKVIDKITLSNTIIK